MFLPANRRVLITEFTVIFLKSNITGITYLHHILAHTDIARLRACKSTGPLDGVLEGVSLGEVDPALVIDIVACAQ